jgi:hypothetical protein
VDIDPETLEELVQVLLLETTNDSSGIVDPAKPDEVDSDGGFDLEVSELDISALYCLHEKGMHVVWRYRAYLFIPSRPRNVDATTDSGHAASFERARSVGSALPTSN